MATIRTGARAAQLATRLRDRFTGRPGSKALPGWQSYYRVFLEDTPGRPLVGHRGPYLGDERRHAQLTDAIARGTRAILISAPPGCGKSRFALEAARRLGSARRSWDVRFVRHDEPALHEELRQLPRGGRLILIVDDAHDCPALVQQLASACSGAQGPSQVHLVCLTRPEGRAALTEVLASRFPVDEPVHIDLGRPDATLVRDLVDRLIRDLSPHHRDVIRRFVADSFFAAVLLCSSVARQKRLPQTLSIRNLRDYAVRQPIARAIGDLCPVEKALRALAVYAASAPVRSGDAGIRSSAAAHAGLPVSDIALLESRVLEAGLFTTAGRELIRPAPELVGDLILQETCLDEQGGLTPFGRSLMSASLERGRYDPVIRNCGAVAGLFSTPPRVDFLSALVLERAGGLSFETREDALALLQGCAPLALREPGTIVRLVDTLTARGALRSVPAAGELSRPDNPEVRAQRLLASAGERDPDIVPRALEYSRRLLACARGDADSQRVVRDDMLACCRFAVARPLAHATAVLDVLTKWVESPDAEGAELAASLLHGFLRLEALTRRWVRDTPARASVALDPTDEICRLRDRALDLLLRCADHPSPAVGYAAADSLGHWAGGYPEMTGELRERWSPRLERELEALAGRFAGLGSTTPHLPVRAAIERQGRRWWLEGSEPFIQRGGKRILEALAGEETYSLWKALHAAGLPVFPAALDESAESQHRAPALIEPSEARAADLARELFDRLDLLCDGPPAWAAMLASVLSAQPRQPLQPLARPYLRELVRRHPDEAWSFISEDCAQGPLGTILPDLLAELRGQDPRRWRDTIQRAPPGTRLFAMELATLCAGGQLDLIERNVVSKGLQLEDTETVHSCARALLSAAPAAPAEGLSAVFATLPARRADVRLWELTLEAFARWGEPLLSAPAGEEADPQLRAVSGELLRLLRTCADALSWEEGSHTRHLTTVLAIFAVAVPHTLKSWMRYEWSTSSARTASASVLSPARMSGIVRLVSRSPAASFWRKQFIEWITEEPDLAIIGARSLAESSGLADPCVASLAVRIASEPTDDSLEALRELIAGCGSSPRLVEDALTLLLHVHDDPEVYGLLEREIIATMARAGGPGADALAGRGAALEAIDRAVRDGDLPRPLRETLARARQAVQGAMAEELLLGGVS